MKTINDYVKEMGGIAKDAASAGNRVRDIPKFNGKPKRVKAPNRRK